MHALRLRAFVACFVTVAVVGPASFAMTTAAAAAKPAAVARPNTVPPLGEYTAVGAPGPVHGGFTSTLFIDAGEMGSHRSGTWRMPDIGSSGNWALMGSTIALVATSFDERGYLYIATVDATRFTGSYGKVGTGYAPFAATPVSQLGATHTPSPSRSPARNASPLARAHGTYSIHAGGTSDALVLTRDPHSTQQGTWSRGFMGTQGTGNWIVLGRHIAMGAYVGGGTGTIYLGILTATGMDSKAKPGVIAPWYRRHFTFWATRA